MCQDVRKAGPSTKPLEVSQCHLRLYHRIAQRRSKLPRSLVCPLAFFHRSHVSCCFVLSRSMLERRVVYRLSIHSITPYITGMSMTNPQLPDAPNTTRWTAEEMRSLQALATNVKDFFQSIEGVCRVAEQISLLEGITAKLKSFKDTTASSLSKSGLTQLSVISRMWRRHLGPLDRDLEASHFLNNDFPAQLSEGFAHLRSCPNRRDTLSQAQTEPRMRGSVLRRCSYDA